MQKASGQFFRGRLAGPFVMRMGGDDGWPDSLSSSLLQGTWIEILYIASFSMAANRVVTIYDTYIVTTLFAICI